MQPIRGTHDLLPEACRAHARVEQACLRVAARYGYGEIRTPILEVTPVFSRSLGDATDVVQKEMYTFDDRGGESVTMRPENTASVARAVLSNGLLDQVPLKLHYAGPMFRYERPQKGRYRQFHQIGVELFGVPEPAGDIEIIAMGADVLGELGLLDNVRLEINTLGDTESREAYRVALVAFLQARRDQLSDESEERLERNPMRVLDSKSEADKAVVADAPSIFDHLTDEARAFFDAVLAGLDALGIAYEVNPRIVRGLDYYCHTAFEFITTELGAQGTVIGGGRYDGLMQQMGGPALPGVGWAGGIERLSMMAGAGEEAARPIALVPVGETAEQRALVLARELRGQGFAIDLGYRGNLKRRMQRANKAQASHALILGDDELERGVVILRDLDSGEQTELSIDRVSEGLPRRA
ncbi:MAG: histidine--tRNA ligase [Rhodospirillaceae bacterium]|nr:histidine--tRNA ligase [Rhodospirillaceae bacterium]MBT6202540.1 histidine--tRNA ligase [Rhodospirillaceae bacterium]MBT6511309.1 histidine--tRNA ligase [Rhodospirillaceae bacterium]